MVVVVVWSRAVATGTIRTDVDEIRADVGRGVVVVGVDELGPSATRITSIEALLLTGMGWNSSSTRSGRGRLVVLGSVSFVCLAVDGCRLRLFCSIRIRHKGRLVSLLLLGTAVVVVDDGDGKVVELVASVVVVVVVVVLLDTTFSNWIDRTVALSRASSVSTLGAGGTERASIKAGGSSVLVRFSCNRFRTIGLAVATAAGEADAPDGGSVVGSCCFSRSCRVTLTNLVLASTTSAAAGC